MSQGDRRTSARTGSAYSANVQFANQLQTNLNDVSALFKHIAKGSKTSDLIGQATKNFAGTDASIANSEEVFHKLTALSTHLGYQQQAIQKNLELSGTVREQLQSINALIAKSSAFNT